MDYGYFLLTFRGISVYNYPVRTTEGVLVMSENGNICKFSSSTGESDLFSFQFIYETMPQKFGANRSYAAFVCHLVTEGTAVYHTSAGDFSLRAGDLFFAFPSVPFTLDADDAFKYLYISFVGSHATELLESVGVTRQMPVRFGMGELTPVWRMGLEHSRPENLSLMTKGVLHFTFAFLAEEQLMAETLGEPKDGAAGSCAEVVEEIRSTIERDFSNADLNLEDLSRRYGYNTKYISRCFRELVGVSFSDYLISCRIRHACLLLEESRMTVREVAAAVGYPDSLYFSKVFKRLIKSSPGEYRKEKK